MFCWHKWGMWSAPYKVTRDQPAGSFGDMGEFRVTVQERECDKCGKVETRVCTWGQK